MKSHISLSFLDKLSFLEGEAYSFISMGTS